MMGRCNDNQAQRSRMLRHVVQGNFPEGLCMANIGLGVNFFF